MPKQIRFDGEDEKLLNSVREMMKNKDTHEWADAKTAVRVALQIYHTMHTYPVDDLLGQSWLDPKDDNKFIVTCTRKETKNNETKKS